MSMTDEELFILYADRGCEVSLAELDRRYRDRLIQFLTAKTFALDHGTAEDIVQEAMLTIIDKYDRTRPAPVAVYGRG